jgi:hypothetical protein
LKFYTVSIFFEARIMLRVIDEKTEIQSAQKSFLSKLNHEADKKGKIIVGHQGKSKLRANTEVQ